MLQWGTLLNQAGTNNIYSEFTRIQAGDCCSLTTYMLWARSIVYTASTFVIKILKDENKNKKKCMAHY